MEYEIRDEHIKLGQLLKCAGLVENGAMAKIIIQDGEVKVNGEVCTMRGKKMYKGDSAEYNGNTVKVV